MHTYTDRRTEQKANQQPRQERESTEAAIEETVDICDQTCLGRAVRKGLEDTRIKVIALLAAVLGAFTFRATFSGSNGSKRVRSPIGMFLKVFNLGIEKITLGYAGILRHIITRRLLTIAVIGVFAYGILFVNRVLPTGFIPLEDQGMIYGIVQTPPGSTLEYTNAKCHELQAVCKELDEVDSVSSIAGYEVLTEGRGSNAGTCIINLKPW
ncbi:MAG: efflux RND transporter permease subunit, partial [Pirellula sp.]